MNIRINKYWKNQYKTHYFVFKFAGEFYKANTSYKRLSAFRYLNITFIDKDMYMCLQIKTA